MVNNKNVETNITKRWETRIPHHAESKKLYTSIAKLDFEFCGDFVQWSSGGDGDNGEMLMYLLDIHFEKSDHTLEELRAQKTDIEKKIEYLQSICPHINFTSKPSARGDSLEGDRTYWLFFACQDCGKTASYESVRDNEEYRKYLHNIRP